MVLSSLVILQKTTEDSESRHGTLPFISAAFNFTIFDITLYIGYSMKNFMENVIIITMAFALRRTITTM